MRIFICEDEINILNQLKNSISQYLIFIDSEIKIELATQNPFSILNFLKQDTLQEDSLFFLDVDLKSEIDGIKLAEEIKNIDSDAKIVFVTTHEEAQCLVFKYMIEAMGYILKDDVNKMYDDIRKCIDMAQNRFFHSGFHRNESIKIRIDGLYRKIQVKEILFFESSLNYSHKVSVHLKNSQLEFFGKLSEIETMNEHFIRCHRSFVANVENIVSFDSAKRLLYFENSEQCIVSMRYLSVLRKIL